MRIGDLSSDVCSSDLVDHHDMTLRREFADPVQDQRGAGRFAGAGRAEQREMLTEQRVDIERSADIAGRIDGADLDMRAFVGGVYLLQIGAGRGIDLCAGDRIARSEEHTSELQSLMRISYAVFCLTKKKK